MDFKVAGTHKGITSIQMDLKIDGLTPEIIKEALATTHKARDYIIDDIILKTISAPRSEVSKYAPKMISMTIPEEKIRDVIGTGAVSYTHLDVYKRQILWFRQPRVYTTI